MADARVEKSKTAIREALLRVMEKKSFDRVTTAEVVREAGVSRSTFYAHYTGVQEVFEELVEEFHSSVSELHTQLKCSSCRNQADRAGKRPYCVALRNAGKYMPLVKDQHYFFTMLHLFDFRNRDKTVETAYTKLGLEPQLSHSLFSFQMSGCYTVAVTTPADCDWEEIQQTLDAFIRGGINAVNKQ